MDKLIEEVVNKFNKDYEGKVLVELGGVSTSSSGKISYSSVVFADKKLLGMLGFNFIGGKYFSWGKAVGIKGDSRVKEAIYRDLYFFCYRYLGDYFEDKGYMDKVYNYILGLDLGIVHLGMDNRYITLEAGDDFEGSLLLCTYKDELYCFRPNNGIVALNIKIGEDGWEGMLEEKVLIICKYLELRVRLYKDFESRVATINDTFFKLL